MCVHILGNLPSRVSQEAALPTSCPRGRGSTGGSSGCGGVWGGGKIAESPSPPHPATPHTYTHVQAHAHTYTHYTHAIQLTA